LTVLTSQRNGLVTIYDISRADDNKLLHVNVSPYALPFVSGRDERYSGFTSFRHHLDLDDTCVSLFQLSNRGAIHRLDLGVDGEAKHLPGLGFEWSAEVKELDLQAAGIRPHSGSLEARRPNPVDLGPVYNRKTIFLFADPF
jgi:hypothetical protein